MAEATRRIELPIELALGNGIVPSETRKPVSILLDRIRSRPQRAGSGATRPRATSSPSASVAASAPSARYDSNARSSKN